MSGIAPAAINKTIDFTDMASKKRIEIKPETFELGKVGHIDILRERCNSIWPLILAELTPYAKIG
mgnify:CR=1 FL=1